MFVAPVWANATETVLIRGTGLSNPIRALIRKPAQRSPNAESEVSGDQKMPATIILGGLRTASKVLDLIPAGAESGQPRVLATLEYPATFPKKLEFPQGLAFLPEAKKMLHDVHSGLKGLILSLKEHPDIDPSRITLVGASFGVPFVLKAAKEDPEIERLVLVHGFAQPREVGSELLFRKWEKNWGAVARIPASFVSWMAWWYFDLQTPESHAEALHAHQKVLVFTAKDDELIPEASRTAFLEALRRSPTQVTEVTTPSQHIRPSQTGMIREIMLSVQSWLQGERPHLDEV